MQVSTNFILLFLATLFSGIGTGLTYLGVAWVLQSMYTDYIALMLLNTLGLVFGMLLLPYFSMLVDRHCRVKVGCYLFLVGFIFQVAFYVINGIKGNLLWLLIAIGVISTILNTLEPVNRVALAKLLSNQAAHLKTTRYLELLQQLTTFIAGFIGVYLVQDNRIDKVLLFDGVSFLVAAIMLRFIRLKVLPESHDDNSLILNNDLTYKDNKWFYTVLSLTSIPFACIMAERVILPGYFQDVLKTDAAIFSMQTIPYAFGAFFAISFAGYFSRQWSDLNILLLMLVLHALAIFAIVLSPSVTTTFVALFFFSCSHCLIRISRTAWLLHRIPSYVFGRVSGRLQQVSVAMIVSFSVVMAYMAAYYHVMQAWWFLLIMALGPVLVFIYAYSGLREWLILPPLTYLPKSPRFKTAERAVP